MIYRICLMLTDNLRAQDEYVNRWTDKLQFLESIDPDMWAGNLFSISSNIDTLLRFD